MNRDISNYRRIVIKIGSALLVSPQRGLRFDWLESLVEDIAFLVSQNCEVLIVSSGAIAMGRNHLGADFQQRALKLNESQAAAAIGQISLGQAFAEMLEQQKLVAGQILLTIGDTETRRRYLNARDTIRTLLEWGAIPIINENDSVATSEIKYGDNDRLAARVASMVGADLLILLSDVDGLYSSPPGSHPEPNFIEEVPEVTQQIEAMAGEAASIRSRGGMRTKLMAAKIATSAGVTMVIGTGKVNHPVRAISLGSLNGGQRSTWFSPSGTPMNEKKKWIAGGLDVAGKIVIDPGATQAIGSGKSLLPAGVLEVEGNFSRGDTVAVYDSSGARVGHGLVEYDSQIAKKIVGLKTTQIERFFGHELRSAMVHRDNLALE
ncbi:MAG: glutamate 5-kinase [Planctomycetota bacterium]